MWNRFLSFAIVLTVLSNVAAATPSKRVSAKNTGSVSGSKTTAKGAHAKSTTSSKKSSLKKAKTRKKLSAARSRRVNRTFRASAELRPMALQLFEMRTPAAYAGVEAYAKKHAGTD